jgi:hypothetical protein
MRLPVLCLVAYLAIGWLPPPVDAQPAATGGGTAAPCRTTALATVPQIFAHDGAVATSESASVERFYIAVTCDAEHEPGDYQVWWKATLASPSSSARLVAIINEQTEACAADCFAVGPDFDFFIEVNEWRMTPGCYGVKAIFGEAVDEFWQCTRTVVYTLAPGATTASGE